MIWLARLASDVVDLICVRTKRLASNNPDDRGRGEDLPPTTHQHNPKSHPTVKQKLNKMAAAPYSAIQPAIQRTDTGDPDIDTTSSTQEPAEGKATLKNSCDLKSTRDEVDNDYLPIIANAILPDAEWTKPYFEMCLPVKMSGSTTFEALFTDDCAD